MDLVGGLAEVGERLALGPDTVQHIAFAGERMAAPRLVVSPHQDLVRRLEEEDLGRHGRSRGRVPSDLHEVPRYSPSRTSTPEGDIRHSAARLRAQLGEGRDQGGGEIVHAEVAQVLEALDGVALPRPGQPGDDDEAQALGRGRAASPSGHRLDEPEAAGARSIQHVHRLGAGIGESEELIAASDRNCSSASSTDIGFAVAPG